MKEWTKKNGSKGSGKRKFTYKYNINDIIMDDNRNFTIIDRHCEVCQMKSESCVSGYTNRIKKSYMVHCNVCGVDFSMVEGNLYYRKDKCPCCSNKRVFVGFNDISTTHPDVVQYFKNKDDAKKYTYGSNKYVVTQCPCCGYERKMMIDNLIRHGYTCTQCSDSISYPNKFLYCLLSQLPVINIEYEYKNNWTLNKRYDAYFEYDGKKYLVEMDGEQHYRENNWFADTYEQIQQNDILKNHLAEINSYILIRIDCKCSNMQYIKNNILHSIFADIFDLSIIDWVKCDNFANKNIFAEIVKLSTNGKNVCEIANILHLKNKTVNYYLHIAMKNGTIDTYMISDNKFADKSLYNRTMHIYDDSEVCDLIINHKKQHPEDTFLDIAKAYNINVATLRSIIQRCVYDGTLEYNLQDDKDENIRRARKQSGKSKRKPIYVYDENMHFIGRFDCAQSAVDSDKNIYDWTLKGIQKVCAKTQKSHRNCIFSYKPIADRM